MGAWGIAILVVGSLVLTVAGRAIDRLSSGWDAPIVAAGAMLSGFVVSEWLGDAGTWSWELDGLFFLPVLIGSVVGRRVELVVRIVTPTPPMPPTTGHRC